MANPTGQQSKGQQSEEIRKRKSGDISDQLGTHQQDQEEPASDKRHRQQGSDQKDQGQRG